MAEKVIAIKMTLDAGQTVTELETINEQLTAIEDDIRNVDKATAQSKAEKNFNDLNKIVEKNVLSIQDLGAAADNYKNIALAAGKESIIGQEALKKASELERELDEVNRSVTQLSEGGRALNASLSLGTAVTAGYAAFQGATAALGIENEDFQKTMIKVQGAQAALMGMQELKIALDKKGILMTTIMTGVEKARIVATNAATIAQGALNFVMSMNPIGLIVLAVVGLVAAFVLLQDEIKLLVEKFFNLENVLLVLLGPIGLLIIAYRHFYGEQAQLQEEQNKQLRESQLEEKKRHEERLKQIDKEKNVKIAAADETIKALELEKDTLEAEGKTSTEVALKMLEAELSKKQAVLDANQEKIQSYIDYYTNLAQLRGQDEQEFKDSLKMQGIDLDSLQDKANEIIKENERNVQFSQNKITKFKREQNEKQVENAQKAQDEINQIAKDAEDNAIALAEKQLQLQKTLEDLRIGNIKDADERGFQQLVTKQQRERDQMIKNFGENAALEKELSLKHENEMLAFQEEINAKKREQEAEHQALLDEMALLKGEEDEIKRQAKLEQLDESMSQIQGFMALASEANEILNEISERRKEKVRDEADKELKNLEADTKKQLAVKGLTENQKIAIENQAAKAKYNIDVKAAEATDKIAKKQFNRNKAVKIAEMAVNTAAGVVQALASSPPPLSFVLGGVSAALGAAQIALVASTKYKSTAGSITPPSFTAPSISTGDDGSASGSTGGGGQASNLQNDTGSSISTTGQVVVSQVDINEQQNFLANVEDVSTIG